jgi:hypothetical protein
MELLEVRSHVLAIERWLAEDVLAAFDRVDRYLQKVRHPH